MLNFFAKNGGSCCKGMLGSEEAGLVFCWGAGELIGGWWQRVYMLGTTEGLGLAIRGVGIGTEGFLREVRAEGP